MRAFTQRARLAAQAAARGVCPSELVRQWLDSMAETPEPPTWDEILKDVRAAAATRRPEDIRPNPVIAARKKRNFSERLR